tara:strand:- start:11096 stop:11548 length:453 start_codon:yes stop_codon:yes gene_type:complete
MEEEKEKYEIEDLIQNDLLTRSELIELIKLEKDDEFVEELIRLSSIHDWGKFKGERVFNKIELLNPDELLFDKYKYLEFDKFLLCVLHQHINLDKSEVLNISKEFGNIIPKMKSSKKVKYIPKNKKESHLDKITRQVLKSYKKTNKNLLN